MSDAFDHSFRPKDPSSRYAGMAIVVGVLTLAIGWALAPAVVRVMNLSGLSATATAEDMAGR